MTFGVTDKYEWQILDDIAEGNKIVFNCLDRLGNDDNKARFAVRKLRTRMATAIPAVKNAVKQLKVSATTPTEAVDNLREQLTQIQREVEEKDQTLLD